MLGPTTIQWRCSNNTINPLTPNKIIEHMNNGQYPNSTDLKALIKSVGGIKLESAKPALQDHEQWVSLPGQELGFICSANAADSEVTRLCDMLCAVHEVNTAIDATQENGVAKQELEQLAMLDPLTELPNRRKLFSCLQEILADESPSAILQIDLDRFKQINDSLGHAAGDEVLIVVANRLAANVRPGDLVARVGGDEFVVACPQVSDENTIAELAERLIESLNQPMQLQGHQYDVGVSIGIAFNKSDSLLEPDALLQNADLALYTSKEQGRNQYHMYRPAMREKFDAAMSMKKELSHACENGSIVAHFQPTFCLQSGLVSSIQAMARWQHSSMGLMTFKEFAPHADEHVLKEIDSEMFNQCLAGIQHLAKTNTDVSKFSITVPIKHIRDTHSMQELQSKTLDFGLSPEQVSLDIVEDGLTSADETLLTTNLDALRDAGFGISLSNFGAPNSNIQSVLSIQPSSIKLDSSLCRNLQGNEGKQNLITGLIKLAENINAAVTATLVETETDRDILAKLGCSFAQGNVLFPPSNIDSLIEWLVSAEHGVIRAA